MQQPPQGFADYPRSEGYDDPVKLAHLKKAYYDVYWVIAGVLVFGLGTRLLGIALGTSGGSEVIAALFALGGLFVMYVVNFVIGYRCAVLIAEAKGKSAGYAVGIGLLTSLLSTCFCGLGGVAVIQTIVQNEVKNYGIQGGFLGLKKSYFDAKIAQLQERAAQRA